MSNGSNDQHWKELADHLRKLNVDYYWRVRNRISEKNARDIGALSRPVRSSGMGISMSMRQEHTPPDLLEKTKPDDSDRLVSEIGKPDFPKRGF